VLASQTQTRLGREEPIPSVFLSVPETAMPTTLVPPLPVSNGESVCGGEHR
jgi:hypothetical protein